jgi:integrase
MTTFWQASHRWLEEMKYKKTIDADSSKLYHLNHREHWCGWRLDQINKQLINKLIKDKQDLGAKPATINRTLSLIKAILRRARDEWEVIDKIPSIKLLKEDNKRVRWLTSEEIKTVSEELPEHTRRMMLFTLATGQRASNIINLKWNDISKDRKTWTIKKEDFKSGKEHTIPLNWSARMILAFCEGDNDEHVFTYKGQKVTQVNTAAWRKALKRAGIKDFKWHDLRHTWASRHLQNGTTLEQLKQLGGWSSYDLVLRYAHLDQRKLLEAAERI